MLDEHVGDDRSTTPYFQRGERFVENVPPNSVHRLLRQWVRVPSFERSSMVRGDQVLEGIQKPAFALEEGLSVYR